MGNDGGSIPKRIELVKEKKKAAIQNPDIERKALWFFCALSKNPLIAPIASCRLGKLYNQDAIIEYLLDKTAYGDGDKICAHVTSMKDITKLNLTENPTFDENRDNNEKSTVGSLEQESVSRYICPISMKEMNGKHRFVYLDTCGCTFSEQALKEVPGSECLTCGTAFTAENIITINPTDKKEIEAMKLAMEEKKAIAKAERKAKKAEKKANGIENGSTKRKVKDNTELPPAKKINLAPSSATAAVVNKVKEELEARNKQQKSSAIQSIYRKKGEEKKQTYLSAGTFNRY
ncbi:Rtf2 RING-finger-domain-containing protein [Umbelopsis sp. PMI_123]|nr:Rtf2 RING-finger-domain-containing protein [Umbelopsis sp. PMI_123]